jgi:hypothetical protein
MFIFCLYGDDVYSIKQYARVFNINKNNNNSNGNNDKSRKIRLNDVTKTNQSYFYSLCIDYLRNLFSSIVVYILYGSLDD